MALYLIGYERLPRFAAPGRRTLLVCTPATRTRLRLGFTGRGGACTGTPVHRYTGTPNPGSSALDYIDADFCNCRVSVSHFSSSNIYVRFCTAVFSSGFSWWFFQASFQSGFQLLYRYKLNSCSFSYHVAHFRRIETVLK